MNMHTFLLEVSARKDGSTLFHLKHIARGQYGNIINECIKKNFIESRCKNNSGDDLYFITEKGKSFLCNSREVLL